MKRLTLATLLLIPAMALAADKPNPADFTIPVHVTSSASGSSFNGASSYSFQILEVVIDGKPLQLISYSDGLLSLGDYKAREATKIYKPHHPTSFDIYKGYDLLMPDGTARTYTVSRLGPALPNP